LVSGMRSRAHEPHPASGHQQQLEELISS